MIRDQLLQAVHSALNSLGLAEVPESVVVERPARREHGDWSTNAALVCAKALNQNPRQLGEALIGYLDGNRPPHVQALEIAGPGFVNFRLAPTWLHDVLDTVIAEGKDNYARLDLGLAGTQFGMADATKPIRVNVEFVSANPTGPLHAGHGRWAAYGDSLCRVLARCSYEPHAETYVNDGGVQIATFGEALAARKAGKEPPEGSYMGAYIAEWAQEMPDHTDPATWGVAYALEDQKQALEAMHVSFDTWSSEIASVEAGYMDSALERLRDGGHVYQKDGATWLRTTDFGDDKDRVLIKSNGDTTYMLPDIGYHDNKYQRGDLIIDVLGADHHGYVGRMSAAMNMLGHPPDSYEVIIGQNVKLMRDGKEVKLSKRTGDIVEIRELVDEVGPDVARFAYLMQSIDTTLTIDIDLLKEQSTENPVFYVQYANARIHSIGRKADDLGIERLALTEADLSLLTHERELEILRILAELPDTLEVACVSRSPQKITNWVRELASAYHGFQHDCPVLKDSVPADLQQARLWLVEGAKIGIGIGLDLLGVDAPEVM